MLLKLLLKLPHILITRRRLIKQDRDYWDDRMAGQCLQVGGRTLNPKAQAFIDLQMSMTAPVAEWTPALIRTGYNQSVAFFDGPKLPVSNVEDISIPLEGRILGARFYGESTSDKTRPALLYYHGGGFVIGGLESHDRLCRKIARDTGQPVIAVDYRLGPENRFPAAYEDAIDSWQWLQDNAEKFNLDPTQISVAGDSAGGLLALLVSALASKGTMGNIPFAAGLIYPAMWGDVDTKSRKTLADENVVLNSDLLTWFSDNFLSGDENSHVEYLNALDDATQGKMPATWVLTCGFDPLRDEGEMIAERLQALGARVDQKEFSELYHGFIGASAIFPEVNEMVRDMCNFILDQQKQVAKVAAE